jgi:putative transposase
MTINEEVLDKLVENYQRPEDILGENGLLKQLTKGLVERMLAGELTAHLGYKKHDPAGHHSGNSRNGSSKKKVKADFGEIELEVPRDRQATFEPKIVPKGERRLPGFDDKILSLYARGMTTRDIQAHLEELYQVEVSAALISNVTDAVLDEVQAWQSRPLEQLYPIVYLDALHVKMRDNGHVQNRAIYTAIAITLEGKKEVLGLWSSANEGAKFWLQVLTELQTRGVRDILIACVDGLKGFPEAIETAFPQTQVQLCIVHLVRASLNYVNWRDRKKVAADLREVYRASTAMEAEHRLEAFAVQWDGKYPTIAKWTRYPSVARLWRENWERVIPFFAFPAEIRRVIYTTNAIESLHMTLRKVTKTRGSFPNEEAARKLLYLALRNVSKKWQTIQNWKDALNRFAILWPGRIPLPGAESASPS